MKLPVPKDEINLIMADYKCTENDAAKAYLDAREKAKEAFKASLSEKREPRGVDIGTGGTESVQPQRN